MQSNYKLKLAVITALSLTAIGVPLGAFALGLGNIEVKSHLGEPLRANIKIQGANELKGEACFRLNNSASLENQLSNANFKLSKIVDGAATLSVTTNQIINEPITSLSILAECSANIRRDYVLLLDPPITEAAPLSAETENNIDEESTQIVENNNAKVKVANEAPAQAQTVKVGAGTKTATAKKQKTSKTSHENINKNADKNIVLTAGYAVDKPAEASNTAAEIAPKNPTQNKLRLSISSGELASNAPDNADSRVNLAGTNLILDKQLHLSPETSPEAYSAEIAVQDEVTVMNNRMAHLQKQISALQQRNQSLEADNLQKTQQITQSNTANPWQWLSYLAGASLLVGGYYAANWVRRRRQLQLENAQALWVDADINVADDDFEELDTKDSFFDNDSQASSRAILSNDIEKSAEIANNAEATTTVETPFSVEEFNSQHNILDHADVFLSHGRTSLAIQLLQNHLLEYPKQSVTIWLFLLDLLAKENMQAAYEQTALECKEHFNIRIAAFSNDEASEKKSFEDFPRLHDALQEIWGTPAAVVFLDDLIYNSRLETRVGFEKSVLEELLLLKNIAHEAISTAEVIQLDEKKIALKERKEAQIAAKKAEKLQQMDELPFLDAQNKLAASEETAAERFEFNLVEHN